MLRWRVRRWLSVAVSEYCAWGVGSASRRGLASLLPQWLLCGGRRRGSGARKRVVVKRVAQAGAHARGKIFIIPPSKRWVAANGNLQKN